MEACADCVTLWQLSAAIGIGVTAGTALVLFADWWYWRRRDAMIMRLQRYWAQRNAAAQAKKWRKNEEKMMKRVQKSDR